jgi:predicted amidophosphoribosyltransferase
VERTDRLAFSVLEEGEPMMVLVVAAFVIALILLVPAVIETVLRAYRDLRRKHDLEVRSGRETRSDHDDVADSLIADEGSTTASAKNAHFLRGPSSLRTTMCTGFGAEPGHRIPDCEQSARSRKVLPYVCPRCWKEIDPGTSSCPSCRFHMTDYESLRFEEKALFFLKHPIRETRMLAIKLLGEMRSRRAVSALRDLLVDERDPDVVALIALTAARIGGVEARELISGLKCHSSALVREVAERLWRETRAGRTQQRRADGRALADDGNMG